MYEYEATLLNVVDGDTVDLKISLGLDAYINQRVRLADIDTPELNSPDPDVRARAALAKQFVIDNLPTTEKALLIRTFKDRKDKYGRYLAIIFGPEQHDVSLNVMLMAAGLAVPYSGGARV